MKTAATNFTNGHSAAEPQPKRTEPLITRMTRMAGKKIPCLRPDAQSTFSVIRGLNILPDKQEGAGGSTNGGPLHIAWWERHSCRDRAGRTRQECRSHRRR